MNWLDFRKPKFEREIIEHWNCGPYIDAKMGKAIRSLMPYFDHSGGLGESRYVDHKFGDVVPVNYIQAERWVAFYRIVRIQKHDSDLALYDDGRVYTMKLERVRRVSPDEMARLIKAVTPDRECPTCGGRKKTWDDEALDFMTCPTCKGEGRVWCHAYPCR